MLHISEQLKQFDLSQKKRFKSERQEIVSKFLDEINKERLGTKYQQLTGRFLGIKLSHIKDNATLYYFFSTCRRYKLEGKGEFSKCFWGSLKVR